MSKPPTSDQIAADPLWLPHNFDVASKRVQFIRISKGALSAPAFLADYTPQSDADSVWLEAEAVAAMQPETAPLHFIFHTAFCRSTLLARVMNIPGISSGLSEPGILAKLAGAGPAAAPLIAPILRLLARPHDGASAVFVKPTNHSNALIPTMMAAMPRAKAIMLTNGLSQFLTSLNRKGMMGRRWGRNLFLEIQGYSSLDMGMDGRESFLMTDLQAAGAAWLLNQRWFAMQIQQFGRARMRTLDGDDFNADRAGTLATIGRFTGVDIDEDAISAVAASDVFTTHSKLGTDFAAQDSADASKANSVVVDDEIQKVTQWITMIADQMGLKVPVSRGDGLT